MGTYGIVVLGEFLYGILVMSLLQYSFNLTFVNMVLVILLIF